MTVPVQDVGSAVDVAVAAVRAGGEIALAHRHRGVAVEEKGALDLVSAADRESERAIREVLTAAFPGDVVVGEEGGADQPLDGRRRWYVDPVDGTTNYLKGLPWWGVSVGLCDHDDTLLAGAVWLPSLDVLYSATLGGGARRDGVPLRCGTTTRLDRTLLSVVQVGDGVELWGGRDRVRRAWQRVGSATLGVRMLGSCSAELCAVADGQLDGMWAAGQSPWDDAAGLLIAKEAGAVATAPDGATVRTPAPAYLLAAPGVHAQLVALLDEG